MHKSSRTLSIKDMHYPSPVSFISCSQIQIKTQALDVVLKKYTVTFIHRKVPDLIIRCPGCYPGSQGCGNSSPSLGLGFLTYEMRCYKPNYEAYHFEQYIAYISYSINNFCRIESSTKLFGNHAVVFLDQCWIDKIFLSLRKQ